MAPTRTTDQEPADTTMMSIVHDAFRRDLTRMQVALSASPTDTRTVGALADHLDWMLDFLHHHHEGEDLGLWPLIRERHPGADPLLDRMEADHARIVPAVERLQIATSRWRALAGASDAGRLDALRAALGDLQDTLLPHLDREESEAMPVVAATLSKTEWQAWDQRYNVRGKSLSRLAGEGHWLMDGLDPPRYQILMALVPAPVRVIIVHVYRPRYRRACARRWGPAVDVRPLEPNS